MQIQTRTKFATAKWNDMQHNKNTFKKKNKKKN